MVLGLIQGAWLDDPEGQLHRSDHEQIRHFRPVPGGPLPQPALRMLLAEAVRVNDLVAREKRSGKRSANGTRRF